MMKSSTQAPKNSPTKLGLLVATPVIALLASCATPTGPVAHRHGDLIHSHVIDQDQDQDQDQDHDHVHGTVADKTKLAPTSQNKAKTRVAKTKPTPAKASDIKPMGLGHKHHSHTDPKTGETTAPC